MTDTQSFSHSRSASGGISPEEYYHTKEVQFPLKYEQYKQMAKNIVLQRQAANLDSFNQFAEEESDLGDWVVIDGTGDSSPTSICKEGFLQCCFEPIVNKRRIKYLNHWVTLEEEYLNCYQSKVC